MASRKVRVINPEDLQAGSSGKAGEESPHEGSSGEGSQSGSSDQGKMEDISLLEEAQERNFQRLQQTLTYYSARLDEIDHRLVELESEWDVESVMVAKVAGVSTFGLVMGLLGWRGWLLLPITFTGFLVQHAISGWNPLATIFYRMGFRTEREIQEERYSLKVLRGDFKDLPGEGDCAAKADSILNAVCKNGLV